MIGYQICNTVQEAAKFEKMYKKSHGALERAIRKGEFVLVSSAGAAPTPSGGSVLRRALPDGE